MKNPYFPFYVRDWLCSRRVLAMSGDAVKAYVYLLAESWLQEPRGTLPQNDEELASMARVSVSTWEDIKGQVLQHYKEGECHEHSGRFYQETLLEISRKSESKQRFKNKNAKRTQTKRNLNASAENEIENEIDIWKRKKTRKKIAPHSFDSSPYYNKDRFKEALKDWPLQKTGYYWYAAKNYSESKGKKYINWIAAVRQWDHRNPNQWRQGVKNERQL